MKQETTIQPSMLNVSINDSRTILGIDTGTSKNTLGYAIVRGSELLAYDCLDGSNPFPTSEILKYQIHSYNVELVLVEDYVYMQHFTYHTMFAQAKRAHMLIGYLSSCFDKLGVNYEIISPVKWKNTLKKYYQQQNLEYDTASSFVQQYVLNDELKKSISTKAELQKNSHWIEAIGICLSYSLASEISEIEFSSELKKTYDKGFIQLERLAKKHIASLQSLQKHLNKFQQKHEKYFEYLKKPQKVQKKK